MAGGVLIYHNHFDLVGSFKMFSILMCTADLSEPSQNSLTASSCFFALNVLCFERVKRHANNKKELITENQSRTRKYVIAFSFNLKHLSKLI